MEEWPVINDYDDLDEWRNVFHQRQKIEIKRVKLATGITDIRTIRLLADVKSRIEDGFVVSRRGRLWDDFNPTQTQCGKLVGMGILKFIDRHWTMADLFKWSNGPIPPAFKYEVTDNGKEILAQIREYFWYS